MKLLRGEPKGEVLLEALSMCVAHRCPEHKDIPPLNTNEGGGAECGACCAEDVGQDIALSAIAEFTLPILDGYADRLEYGARLRAKLESARERLNLIAPGAGDEYAE
jgi:hypothetical protein